MGRLCCRRFAVCDSPACAVGCGQERVERALAELAQSYPDIMVPREHREEIERAAEAAEKKIRWV